jgi:hypothetical protein
MDESSIFCNFCCAECCCINVSYRSVARARFGVLGNETDDCLIACCCTFLSNVQIQLQWEQYLVEEMEQHQQSKKKPVAQTMELAKSRHNSNDDTDAEGNHLR